MATNLAFCDCADEDYIDMELNSSPQNREFEFQMSFSCNDKETTTSPADVLFYKGKLLPLHLPPRRQMVENLLHTTATTATVAAAALDITKEAFEEDNYYSAPCTNTTNTPLESCNISPSESCRVSCELNPEDYSFEWSTESSSFIDHTTKKSWPKKLKLIKHSILGQKLRASRAYLKALFSKSVCSNEKDKGESLSKVDFKIGKKKPFGHISRTSYPNNIDKEDHNVQRRSFSGAITPTKCLSSSSSNSSSSSSSFSFSSNGPHELQFLRRSSSAAEIEVSIDAAIAHCKKSQQIFHPRNSTRIDDGEDGKSSGLCSI